MMNYKIKIGTRESNLALYQAIEVEKKIRNLGFETEIVKIKTHGDMDQKPFSISKDFGLFTKKINEELLNEDIDIAVHSMKDLPSEIEEGIKIIAVLKRDFYEDFFVSYKNIFELENGKKVGTSSQRRKSFLKMLRPDLEIVDVRGNVETRIKRLENNEIDALILSLAGIKRLNLSVPGHVLDPDIFVPQANQGIIVILTRKNFFLNDKISEINDSETFIIAYVEREFLKVMNAGCHSSLGVLARYKGNRIILHLAYIDEKRYDYYTNFQFDNLNEEIIKFRRWFYGR